MATGVTFAQGFRAAGVACGLKKNGNPDLALVVSDVPAKCAGIFTRNVVKGHSLQLCARHSALGLARAVIINSGCANACVGMRGDADALTMACLGAQAVGCSPQQVLTASTGVIGVPLNMDKIQAGISLALPALSAQGGSAAAQAIMTTDTVRKEVSAQCVGGGKTISLGAMAKGSGMIHPDMATMISVITTDAAISATALKAALKAAADGSYNRISVDGDTSVCDTVVILANGLAGNPVIEEGQPEYSVFLETLRNMCLKLARMLAADGESATKLMEIQVNGAPSDAAALAIAQAVAKSPLVKTALYGQDANCGRIFTAAGYSGARFDPSKVDIYINALKVYENGCALPFDENAALKELEKDVVLYRLELHQGDGHDFMLSCDLTHAYVEINGAYRT
ncbi:MAG: bifunctional glutamate N-acetyltransferase/amino-acid acetyltransferase ArgJ [Eubacteriales bacterium]|nr:bifunctional glutamate N-acetyltransferase/amino-acid acetyltransferase ArgJ [Eubacteriales bacterium]